jgi:hypothetical protein
MFKKSHLGGMLAVFLVIFMGCENATDGVTQDELEQATMAAEFTSSNPSLPTLDKALTYFSKWVRTGQGDTERTILSYYVNFTPSRFGVSSAFAGIPKGSYPYSLTRDGDGYILKIAAWFNSDPGAADSLKPVARIAYDPDKLTLVFNNYSDDDADIDWGVDGSTFSPDLTEYYTATDFVSSTWVSLSGNIPDSAANRQGTISFSSGNMVTSNASEVFTSTAVNNKSTGITWAVIGKERKLIASSSSVDLGTLTLEPEKGTITLGGQKFAQTIALCGFICSYYEVDCCPYINGNWAAIDEEGEVYVDDSKQANFYIMAGQGYMKVTKTKDGTDAVDSSVYGEGLASINTETAKAYGIAVADGLAIYAPGSNLPLLTFNNLEDVDSQKVGNSATTPNPRIITLTPAKAGASVIRLKKL